MHHFTVDEYLALEEQSPDRHEYLNGEIFAMAGGTDAHADICANIVGALWAKLKGSACKVRGSDMRLRTHVSGLYSYADAVVCCADSNLDRNTLLNPVVIVEVLSPSTENYDRGKKFVEYRRIASFQEYLVVAQDQTHVEHFVRGDGIWTMREYNSVDDVISIGSVGMHLPLAEIYSGLQLPVDPLKD